MYMLSRDDFAAREDMNKRQVEFGSETNLAICLVKQKRGTSVFEQCEHLNATVTVMAQNDLIH